MFRKPLRHWGLRELDFQQRIFSMSTTRPKLVARLQRIAAEIAALIEELEPAETTETASPVPNEVRSLVAELMRRGYCLGRHKMPLKNGEPEKPRRGMCGTDYRIANRAVNLGTVSEEYLITNGWWTEDPKGGGRKPNIDSPFAKALNAVSPTEFAGLNDDEVIARINSLTQPMLPEKPRPTLEEDKSKAKADLEQSLSNKPAKNKK